MRRKLLLTLCAIIDVAVFLLAIDALIALAHLLWAN